MKSHSRYRLIQSPDMVVQFDSLCSGVVVEGVNAGFRSNDWYPCDDRTRWEPVGESLPTFHPHPDHSRFLKVVLFENGVEKTMNIEVRYLGESNAENGCLLDHIVMPTIKERLNVVK